MVPHSFRAQCSADYDEQSGVLTVSCLLKNAETGQIHQYERHVDVHGIIARLKDGIRSYHAALHDTHPDELPDDHVSGFFDDIAKTATSLAANKGVQSLFQQVAPLIATAVPGGSIALQLANKLAPIVSAADDGHPEALGAVAQIAAKAKAGDPRAQHAMHLARSLHAVQKVKDYKTDVVSGKEDFGDPVVDPRWRWGGHAKINVDDLPLESQDPGGWRSGAYDVVYNDDDLERWRDAITITADDAIDIMAGAAGPEWRTHNRKIQQKRAAQVADAEKRRVQTMYAQSAAKARGGHVRDDQGDQGDGYDDRTYPDDSMPRDPSRGGGMSHWYDERGRGMSTRDHVLAARRMQARKEAAARAQHRAMREREMADGEGEDGYDDGEYDDGNYEEDVSGWLYNRPYRGNIAAAITPSVGAALRSLYNDGFELVKKLAKVA